MARGRPKLELSPEQEIWDNYNPYYVHHDPKGKELEEYYDLRKLNHVEKVLTQMCNLAGKHPNKHAITILSKKILDKV